VGLSELDIISRYFNQSGLAADPLHHAAVSLGIGDDCAGLRLAAGQELMLSMDVLVEGVHFPASANPADIARRALAVNLSDLAAMGAQPLGFMLGLTLPDAQPYWLEGFSQGLKASATRYGCPLLGGNLTRGPRQIAIQVQGQVPAGMALLRSGARAGDKVFVSGSLGTAGLALQYVLGELPGVQLADQAILHQAFYDPEPRLALGIALRDIASATLDISDGLLGDAAHLARSSGVQVGIDARLLPLDPVMMVYLDAGSVRKLALTAGDDYELLFTVPVDKVHLLEQLALAQQVPLTCIGVCRAGEGVVVEHGDDPEQVGGYDHFRSR